MRRQTHLDSPRLVAVGLAFICCLTAVHLALQVGRAGRFGTKGLAITFVASETDSAVLNSVQVRCSCCPPVTVILGPPCLMLL